ncbi:MAG: hypothetical protein JSV42_10065 [Chloroflexota bacterium]|nr:MAG: hypothetical protein JSV42_10065 [Chloroflexota bacterium]
MVDGQVIYICPICFRVCEQETECHEYLMVTCETGQPGDERRKPITDRFGNLVSRAPFWYLEALTRERKAHHSDPS